MTHPEMFEHADAAYLMGLLPAGEREAFEAHLVTCTACAGRVRELRPTLDLLDVLRLDDVVAIDEPSGDAGPIPDTLLPGLLRRAGVARRRRHWTQAALSAVAAACAVALVLVLLPASSSGVRPQAMSALVSTPLRATAAVSRTEWGTRISLDCQYVGAISPYAGRTTYQLTVVSRDGSRHTLGSWSVAPGVHTRFESGTALSTSSIGAVLITTPGGQPVLSLNL